MASTSARGYGWSHQKLRAQWAPKVARGDVACWRCGRLIGPHEEWHLGHDDNDRTVTHGPEHAHRTPWCRGNMAWGAINGNKKRAKPRVTRTSRAW